MDCSPSDAHRAVSSGAERCIKVWDLARGFCLRNIMVMSLCNSVRLSFDGSVICSGHYDGTLRFWDMRSYKQANEVTGLHTQQICSLQLGRRTGITSLSYCGVLVAAHVIRSGC